MANLVRLIPMLTNLYLKDYPAALRRIVAQSPAGLIEQEINLPTITKYLDSRREYARLIEKKVIALERKHLTELQQQIIASVGQYGYWQGTIDNIFDCQQANNLMSICDAYKSVLQEDLSRYHYNQHNTVTLSGNHISQNSHNWMVYQLGLNEKLLQIAHQYIGLPVGYHGAEVRLSRANPYGLDMSGPRAPHQDCEEGQIYPMLKAILYLSDITEDNGPFTMVQNAQHKPLTGCKGTLILADTSLNLHYGMPLKQGERMVLFWTYSSHRPRYPHRCIIWPHSHMAVRKMTHNMNRSQQKAARWREYLPLLFCPVRYYPFPGHNWLLGDRNFIV